MNTGFGHSPHTQSNIQLPIKPETVSLHFKHFSPDLLLQDGQTEELGMLGTSWHTLGSSKDWKSMLSPA